MMLLLTQRATVDPQVFVIASGMMATRTSNSSLTVTMRIAHLIMKKGASPDRILAVTFTRKAAEEMQNRLHATFGDTAKLPLVATFHAFCFKILNDLSAEKTESVIDEDERFRKLQQLLFVEDGDLTDAIKNEIEALRGEVRDPEEIKKRVQPFIDQKVE